LTLFYMLLNLFLDLFIKVFIRFYFLGFRFFGDFLLFCYANKLGGRT